jgi:hypothetical protein
MGGHGHAGQAFNCKDRAYGIARKYGVGGKCTYYCIEG